MAEGGPLENNQDADNEIDRLRQHFSTIRRRISELVEVAEKERNHDWTIKCLKLVVDYVPTLQESNIGLGIGVNDIRDVLLTGADGQLVKNDQVIDPLSIFETLDRECENWLRDHPEEEPIVPDSATSPLTTVKKCDPLTTFNIIQEKRPYEVYKGAGAALIIKVSDYSSSVHPMNSLPGADADFNNLWNFLTQFKCSVEPCMNQSAEEIRQTIKKWSNKKEVREASIIFVALIGHGNNGIFFASDGDSIPIFDLIQCIDNLHCSDNPRPKIILNLCCRGGLMQVGSNYEKPEEYHMKRPSHLTFKVNPSEGIQTTEATEIVPAHSDFLFIYSTSQHMVATEAPEGNTFLRELLENLSEKCHNTDIVSILREINYELGKIYCKLPMDTSEIITLPSFESYLRKLLYLFPGFGKNEFEQGRKQFEEQSAKEARKKNEMKRMKRGKMLKKEIASLKTELQKEKKTEEAWKKMVENQDKEIEQLRKKLGETERKLEETKKGCCLEQWSLEDPSLKLLETKGNNETNFAKNSEDEGKRNEQVLENNSIDNNNPNESMNEIVPSPRVKE